MPNWTYAQEDAINARNGTVLVSAAAGSGKTAVLVERIIERLTDKENPTDANKLLVVTFTKAAAAEMRGRIEAALVAEIQKNPESSALHRQQILLSQANICTVDSFCSKISREFFQLLDISPDFKIVADKQQEELQSEAVNTAIDELFEKGETALADAFSGDRDDKKLIDTVMSLYKFTGSHLFPEKWLESKLSLYNGNIPPKETPWGEKLVAHASDILNYCLNIIGDSLKLMAEDETLQTALNDTFADDKNNIYNLLNVLLNGTWDDFSAAVSAVPFSRFPTVKGYGDDPLKKRLQNSRDTVKGSVKKLAALFADSQEDIKNDIINMQPVVTELSNLVKRFGELYNEAKKEKNLADYTDIEHYAVKLFLEEDEGVLKRTELAKTVSERYDEIMIDEYQDTNSVQDWIFRSISKNNSNLFMVGDVKQSIYSFRQAMPDIFIRYKGQYNRYSRDEKKYPATIVLDKNFRSRPEVINSVNYVFSQLMSEEVGGVEYEGDEALSQGLECTEKTGCETVVDFIEKSDNITAEIAEARHIAATVKEMIEGGFTVTDKGVERKATYRDFCVLLRSANRFAFNYADEMSRLGVPAWAAVAGGFFTSPEIQSVMSFLQVIDNPNQDIPLLSVLLGPVYGFSADDIARLRAEDRENSIYVSMTLSGDDRYSRVLKDIEHYRLYGATMPSDVFINYVYSRTGYTDIVLAMENGENRLANLYRLQQYAKDYESAGYIGLSGFIRFMDKLKSAKSDLESANLVSENADVVRIMSIHKSKGLEFPVCIIAGCGREFNRERSDISLNSRLGLGVKLKDKSTGVVYSNIIRNSVILENQDNAASEELRVFYVAMTRAREKLIMLSTVSNIDKALNDFSSQITGEAKLPKFSVKSVNSISGWLMLCALRHPDAKTLRDRIMADEVNLYRASYTPWTVRVIKPQEAAEVNEKAEVTVPQPDLQLAEKIKSMCNFTYPYSEINKIPVKVTASAIAGEDKEITLNRPSFLSFKGLTPAERGIALHSYMQFADFSKAINNPELELKRLVDEGFITAEQGKAVNLNHVRKFLKSDLGTRISKSDTVKKEQQFSVNIKAEMINLELSEEYRDTPVILQGAVDCSFVEDNKLYIIDFKTDRVEDGQELVDSYGIQLKLYAHALRLITGMEVGGCYLYSLYLDKAVTVS